MWTVSVIRYVEWPSTWAMLMQWQWSGKHLARVLNICRGLGWLSRYSDSLRAGRSGDQIPVGARFFAPVQTGPGAHPASYTMGTGSFPEAKRPGRSVDHPPPSSAKVKERVELYLYSPFGPLWPVLGWTLPFTCTGCWPVWTSCVKSIILSWLYWLLVQCSYMHIN